MNVLGIAYREKEKCKKKGERNCEVRTRTWKKRQRTTIYYTTTWIFFLFRLPKVTRVTRVRFTNDENVLSTSSFFGRTPTLFSEIGGALKTCPRNSREIIMYVYFWQKIFEESLSKNSGKQMRDMQLRKKRYLFRFKHSHTHTHTYDFAKIVAQVFHHFQKKERKRDAKQSSGCNPKFHGFPQLGDEARRAAAFKRGKKFLFLSRLGDDGSFVLSRFLLRRADGFI